jgi:hypothetical protein
MGFTVHPRRLQHFGAPADAFILIRRTQAHLYKALEVLRKQRLAG